MSSERPAPPGGDEQSINPYAATRVPNAALEPVVNFESPPQRQYQARLAWSDRRAFLCSVGLIRIAAAAGAMVYLKVIYDVGVIWYEARSYSITGEANNLTLGVMTLAYVAQSLVALALCWAAWRYANHLAAVAGGTSSDTAEWARAHYRMFWLAAATLLFVFAFKVVGWIMQLVELSATSEVERAAEQMLGR